MSPSLRRDLLGAAVALAAIAALSAVMVADRRHLAQATAALVLVVPVVLGVILGGFRAGAVAVVAGFFAFDLFFIPPYNTLTVGTASNWVALVVYVVVMALVARVVASLRDARAEARRHDEVTRHLYQLSDALIARQGLAELLGVVAETIRTNFDARWVTVLLPEGDALRQVASAGEPLTDGERAALSPAPGRPESLTRSEGTRAVHARGPVGQRPAGRPGGARRRRPRRPRTRPAAHLRQPGGARHRARPALRAGAAGRPAGGGGPVAPRPHGGRLPRPAHPARLGEDGRLHPAAQRRGAGGRRPRGAPGTHRAAVRPAGPPRDQSLGHDADRGRDPRAAARVDVGRRSGGRGHARPRHVARARLAAHRRPRATCRSSTSTPSSWSRCWPT